MDAKTDTNDVLFIFTSGSETELTSLDSLTFILAVKDLESDHRKLSPFIGKQLIKQLETKWLKQSMII